MTHKVYEMEADAVAVDENDSSGRHGKAGLLPITVNVEADSLDAAKERAVEVAEEVAEEFDRVERVDGELWLLSPAPDGEPPKHPQTEIEGTAEFVDMTVAAATAPLGTDVPDVELFCPHHGQQRSWTYQDGNRYCREDDCGHRLVNIREVADDE